MDLVRRRWGGKLCGGQKCAFVAGEIESLADEFRKGMVRQGIREKYREAMAERKGDDEFGS